MKRLDIKIKPKIFWCWLCKKTQSHIWIPKLGAGVADGKYKCVICDSIFYG